MSLSHSLFCVVFSRLLVSLRRHCPLAFLFTPSDN
uniref:Uncharacterized protein n=1 Tax=Anguilla anguilla TaxID=7936 RepID=A0A0E9UUR5_ANGAN